jgi:hypothetical protein
MSTHTVENLFYYVAIGYLLCGSEERKRRKKNEAVDYINVLSPCTIESIKHIIISVLHYAGLFRLVLGVGALVIYSLYRHVSHLLICVLALYPRFPFLGASMFVS